MSALAYALIFIPLFLGICTGAVILGGPAERSGAICILAANILAEVLILISGKHYPGHYVFALDFLLAVALLLIAIRYSSLWLGGAMILQGIALYIHALAMMGDEVSVRLYVILNNYLTFLMLVCIALGTISKISKRRQSPPLRAAPLPH